MSESATESDVVQLPHSGDAAFASLMDTIAPENDDGTPKEKSETVGAPAVSTVPPAGGSDAAAGSGSAPDPAAGGTAATPTAGDPVPGTGDGGAGSSAAPGGDGAPAGTPEQPAADGGGAAGQFAEPPDFGALSTQLEERTQQAYQQQAITEVRDEHPKYFEALDRHPRSLVGMEVPAIGREGTERLKDVNDAREWQDAVRHLLVEEVQDRVSRSMDDSAGIMQTLHQSIELFQNNSDLVPNTSAFDQELADRFAKMVEPYELHVDGKFQGYTIAVQPIVNNLREQLANERAARTAAGEPGTASTPAAPAAAAGGTPASPPAAADAPQAGISSKAGSSGEVEDFSTLFATIGLPNLQI